MKSSSLSFPASLPWLQLLVIDLPKNTPLDFPHGLTIYFSALETLALQNTDFEPLQRILVSAPKLVKLALCCIHSNSDVLSRISWSGSKVNEVKLRIDTDLRQEEYQWLFTPLEDRLHSLDLSEGVGTTTDFVGSILTQIGSTLSRLRLTDAKDKEIMKKIKQQCIKLDYLVYEGGPDFDWIDLPPTVTRVEALLILDLDMEGLLDALASSEWLPRLAHLPRITQWPGPEISAEMRGTALALAKKRGLCIDNEDQFLVARTSV